MVEQSVESAAVLESWQTTNLIQSFFLCVDLVLLIFTSNVLLPNAIVVLLSFGSFLCQGLQNAGHVAEIINFLFFLLLHPNFLWLIH